MRNKLPVRWDENTNIELEEIYNSIKRNSPQNAFRVINTLLDLGDSIGHFPEKYPIDRFIDDKVGNIRSVSKWSFKIIYKVTKTEVIIITIVNTSFDPEKLYKNFL